MNFRRSTGQTGPQKERLECGAAGEASGGEDRCGVCGRRPHRPRGVERGAARRWNQKGFPVSRDAGFEVLRLLLAAGVYGVAIEDRGNAIAVEAVIRARCGRLRCSEGGDEQEQTGEMASAQRHSYLQFR